jgi:nitroreductase
MATVYEESEENFMLDMLLARRSCRKFEDKAVEAEKKEKLLQAAQLAPSGKSTRPWEFIVIENRETLQKLGDCRSPSQPFLPETPLAIVVLADTQKTDTWIEDAAIASIVIQLEAEALGLGSCWVQIRLRESNQGMSSEAYVRKLLRIPEHMAVLSIIAVGYPKGIRLAHRLDEVDRAKIHTEAY